jgi:hypothetical protein
VKKDLKKSKINNEHDLDYYNRKLTKEFEHVVLLKRAISELDSYQNDNYLI